MPPTAPRAWRYCPPFCVWSRREEEHPLPCVISPRPRGCPEGRDSHSDSWMEVASWGPGARCGSLHRGERSWPEKRPSPQALMRAGKDPSADLTILPLPRTELWLAHRSRCLQRPDFGARVSAEAQRHLEGAEATAGPSVTTRAALNHGLGRDAAQLVHSRIPTAESLLPLPSRPAATPQMSCRGRGAPMLESGNSTARDPWFPEVVSNRNRSRCAVV